MLTLNSADETDKNDNTAVSIAHNKAQQIQLRSLTLMSWWHDDGVMENMSIVFISCHFSLRIYTNQFNVILSLYLHIYSVYISVYAMHV